MAKLAVLLLVAVAFQATLAQYFHHEGKLVTYLDEIRTEVKDLTLFFEKDFPEHDLAVDTVTWQCHKLVDFFRVIIGKLREEIMVGQNVDHHVFREVIDHLEEVCLVLKRVTITRDVHEIKRHLVVAIHTVYDRLERLVHLTYTVWPEFRFTLKYILVDFMTCLHGIRHHFLHINSRWEEVRSPRVLIRDIHEYIREFTDIIKEFVHPAQLKVALRGYLLYVNEVVRKLEEINILEHKELDLVLHHLTDKLREIVFPLKEIMYNDDNIMDIKTFRTKIVAHCFEVVSTFEQLVQLCDDKVLPDHVKDLLMKIIYHYWYAVKHVCYEIKFGHKIGFYAPKFYEIDFYRRHGFGHYEHEPYYERDLDTFNPYRYETLFPVRGWRFDTVGKWDRWDRYVKFPTKYFGGRMYDDKFLYNRLWKY